MLDNNIKKPEETRSGNPTPRQQEYVKKLASQTGEDLSLNNGAVEVLFTCSQTKLQPLRNLSSPWTIFSRK